MIESSHKVRERPVCLVTGAGGTLGSAFARAFADRYHIAAVWYRRRPMARTQGQRLFDPVAPKRPLPVNDHQVFAVRADVTNSAQVENLIDRVLAHFGRIDIILNLAVAARWQNLLSGTYSENEIITAFQVNVAAPLILTTTIARKVWRDHPTENRKRNRSVVNVSSTAGTYVYPGYGQALYSSTKAALNMLSRHMAAEFEPLGVRVNVLAPDTFPGRLSVRQVLAAIHHLIEGRMSGQIRLQFEGGVEHVLEC